MTQVEKLRTMSKALRGYSWGQSLSDYLDDAASEIEREHAEDCFRMGERAAEDAEAIAWVREHGGLSHVKDILHDFRAVVERLGIEWSESELHGLMYALDRRLMPEGCEWPRYDTGEPVRFGDEFLDHQGNVRSVLSVKMYQDGGFVIGTGQGTYDWHSAGERVKRPAVLAGDGEPLEAGQTVYHIADGCEYRVVELLEGGAMVEAHGKPTGRCRADYLTHQRPVLDANGVPIREGDTVYGAVFGGPFTVTKVSDKGSVFVDVFPDTGMHGSMFTHTKPEPPDSWERIEEDATLGVNTYRERYGIKKHDGMTWPQLVREDLVRRCRALAERERGE